MMSLFWIGMIVSLISSMAFWSLRLLVRNEAFADVAWSFNVALLCLFYYFFGEGSWPYRLLGAGLGTVWGLRLSVYVFRYRIYGKQKDLRYADAMQSWGKSKEVILFGWFLLQGFLSSVFSIPALLLCMNSGQAPGFPEWFFAGLVLAALFLGGLADEQLAGFRKDPGNRGKVCREGLWYYSRHPNYFFEVLLWTAFGLCSLFSPHGYWGLLPAVLVAFFIFRVSGIPMTEQRALQSKGQAYREYQKTTSLFVPWFPKKGDA